MNQIQTETMTVTGEERMGAPCVFLDDNIVECLCQPLVAGFSSLVFVIIACILSYFIDMQSNGRSRESSIIVHEVELTKLASWP